jgi:glutaredoxin 3
MKAELYTWSYCPFCQRAKALLDERGIEYVDHVMDTKPDELDEVKRKYQHETVPIVLLDGTFIGGFTELSAAL